MVFPVKAPYTVSADIVKYSGDAFNKHPDPSYLLQKKRELDAIGHELTATTDQAMPLVKTMGKYCGLNNATDIRSIALACEEDIAILYKGQLVSICFCFPSGFVPAQKLGESFFGLHLPVADGDNLRASSEKVTAIISRDGALFRRHVWTVTSLPGLSQHPSYQRPAAAGIDDLYFRTETQTTVGIAGDGCLFFVKVDMHPLALVWNDQSKRGLLLESINSMTAATLEYKNLHQVKKILNTHR
jgi:hypothetical protein